MLSVRAELGRCYRFIRLRLYRLARRVAKVLGRPIGPDRPPGARESTAAVLTVLSPLLSNDERVLVSCEHIDRALEVLNELGHEHVEGFVETRDEADGWPQLADQVGSVSTHVGGFRAMLEEIADDAISTTVIIARLADADERTKLCHELVRVSKRVMTVDAPSSALQEISRDFAASGAVKVHHYTLSANNIRRFGRFAGFEISDFRRMDKRSTLHKFWRQSAPDWNRPEGYVARTGRSEALAEVIADLPKGARILEIGCNVGRNLAFLHDSGYHRVEGIEINPSAIALLRRTFPQLDTIAIHEGPAGDHLPTFEDDEFDLIFTMAVIEHLHPEEATIVFDHMVRVGKMIVSIEPHPRTSHRQYPHDVARVFGSRGLSAVLSRPMTDFRSNVDDRAMDAYTVWRFERTD